MATTAELPPDREAALEKHPFREVTVRVARPRDARSFLELYRAVVAERRFIRSDAVRRTERDYRKRFRDGWTEDRASLVATVGDRVVGHLGLVREDNPANRHVASIGMAVAADWRRRGVGSALIAEAIRWAKEMGVEKLALSVYPDNDAAISLYRKFGFREEGRLRGHSKKAIGYRDEVVMGLWVSDPPPPEMT
jgi:putative acetyltransferase